MSQWGVDMGAQGLVVEVLDGSESHGGEFTTGSLEMIRARSKAQQVEGRGIPPLRLRSGQALAAKVLITGFERDLRGKDGAAVFVVVH
jgi:hypothetical protein